MEDIKGGNDGNNIVEATDQVDEHDQRQEIAPIVSSKRRGRPKNEERSVQVRFSVPQKLYYEMVLKSKQTNRSLAGWIRSEMMNSLGMKELFEKLPLEEAIEIVTVESARQSEAILTEAAGRSGGPGLLDLLEGKIK